MEKSLQEIAQMRMAPNLKKVIQKWSKETGNQEDFWEWRNALNLVPPEDTNCRTLQLVYRPVHIAFKHRGGVANAINIKKSFRIVRRPKNVFISAKKGIYFFKKLSTHFGSLNFHVVNYFGIILSSPDLRISHQFAKYLYTD